MIFDFSKAIKAEDKPAVVEETKPLADEPAIKPLAIKAVKLNVQTVATPLANQKPVVQSSIEGLDLLDSIPEPLTYKEQLAEMPSLDELANEFNNPEQPDDFNDAALAAVHKACLSIESAIDNAEEVRSQLTFIMTELRKYPETAAKIYDSDIATMVKALRHNYNVVAFAKAANKKAKAEKASKVNDLLAAADASGLFDGLDL